VGRGLGNTERGIVKAMTAQPTKDFTAHDLAVAVYGWRDPGSLYATRRALQKLKLTGVVQERVSPTGKKSFSWCDKLQAPAPAPAPLPGRVKFSAGALAKLAFV
jgi:hypothetical protein